MLKHFGGVKYINIKVLIISIRSGSTWPDSSARIPHQESRP